MKKKFNLGELVLFIIENIAIFFAFSIPLSWCRSFGKGFGDIFYWLSAKRRNIALSNLHLAFPKASSCEIRRLAKRSFESFGINYMEGIRIAKTPPNRLKEIVSIADGDKDLYQRLIASEKGVVLLGCHSGSLPVLLTGLSVYGLKLHSITGTSNRYTDAWLKEKASLFGLNLIKRNHGKSYTELIAILESHEAVNFFTDMDWCYSKGVFVDFFGKAASSPRGPARIFYRHDYWCVMIYIERKGSFDYVIHLEEFDIDRTVKDKEQFVAVNMQRFTSYFEDKIRRDPQNWTWHHPRWRTRPKNDDNITT